MLPLIEKTRHFENLMKMKRSNEGEENMWRADNVRWDKKSFCYRIQGLFLTIWIIGSKGMLLVQTEIKMSFLKEEISMIPLNIISFII